MKFLKRLTISIFLLSSLIVSNANAGDCKARLGDFDWSSANIHTAITTFILEKGYGCEVSVTKGKYYTYYGRSLRWSIRCYY